ncbi:MAG: hypothetical protein IFK92_06185 [Acidobacteria bacterium]|nr:hypothetical protein [Candidatus Sulfomarinibacter kjeldsenii]
MNPVNRVQLKISTAVAFALIVCFTFTALPVCGVNVVKGMGAKKIAADIAKELTLAAGSRYKVKQNDKKVVVKKANKKEKPLAIEMSNQKLTGVSIMIGKN